MKKEIITIIFLFTAINSFAIERNRTQFLSEPSYLIFPLPYSLPGIGQGVMVTGLVGNVYDTNVDAYVIGITGDAQGAIVAVEDIHIIPEFLILDIMHQDISKAVVNNYEKRGMNSKKSDFNLLEVNKVLSDNAKLTLSLYDRRFELYAVLEQQKASIVNIRSSDGKMISELQDPFISKSKKRRFGLLVDYTDDYVNPTRGVRFNAEYISSNAQSDLDPEFYTIDKSLSFYLPVAKPITWVLHFFLSDAYVTKKGETDPVLIRKDLGLNCLASDTDCLKAEADLVSMFINMRTNGTATSLGGEKRLRSYPGDRYSGAHSFFSATELRWNVSEGIHPFDYWIWKDVATGLQLALFYEIGSVSETQDEIGDITKTSYGGGFRLVSASGFVYRADYAHGDEGGELTVMFSYPF